MNAKKFVLYFFYTIVGFVLFNLIVWNLYTKKILIREDGMISGDLTRMGYIPELVQLRKNSIDLPKVHFEPENYHNEKIDLITIGDSFSNGMGFGYNRFYQDYMASKLNWNILNINQHPQTRNFMETVVLLANSGFFEKTNTKYVLIESSVRKIVGRHIGHIDYTKELSLKKIEDDYHMGDKNSGVKLEELPPVSFINNGNFKYLAYRFLYKFSERAVISKTHKVELSKPLFSVGNGKELLYYHNSIDSMMKNNTQNNLILVNENLNRLADFLQKEHGVTLIFMPAVTKYDLYSSYIVNNQHPSDPFFPIFKNLNKRYLYIDTKEVLLDELQKGEKDIFYCDDTHWTYKASAAISESFAKMVSSQ